MSAPAAISASLVNMRNVGTHKSVALTIHVPEEQAQHVIEAFGWPTMASPVPVAVARLDPKVASKPAEPKERKVWADLPPSQQSAIRCEEQDFRYFLQATKKTAHTGAPINAFYASETIRRFCGVKSRAELNDNHKARVLWHQLDSEFLEWSGRLPHG